MDHPVKKKIRLLLAFTVLVLGLFASMSAASAAETEAETPSQTAETEQQKKKGWQKEGKYWCYYSDSGKLCTGWKKIGGKLYYLRKKAEDDAPKGSRATGLYKVGSKTFYFSSKGVLQTGWKKIDKAYYYFAKSGKAGSIGAMYTGMKTINGGRYYFKNNGKLMTGWVTYKGGKYYFSKSSKVGERGKAYTGWKTIGGKKYYFNSKGLMQKNHWISKTYYVGSDGVMLKSCITPDGYKVNSRGEKVKLANGWVKQGGKYYYYVSGKKATGWKTISGKKYYFDSDGVRQNGWLVLKKNTYYLKNGVQQTGWQTIGGKTYYFMKNGRMAKNTTFQGVKIGADGVAENKKISILLIAGHGQGDIGAVGRYGSTTYYEYKYTRQFATLVQKALAATGADINVTMYNQNYDCYQVVAGKKNGPSPNFENYDYVLEIHFNATAESAKDSSGDGQCKGIGMYVNSGKKDTSIDKAIIRAVNSQTGFRIWGGSTGVWASSTLLNAKTCQSKGVSYGLLETAFIDDKDDMKFYNSNKKKMAKAVASAIVSSFGL